MTKHKAYEDARKLRLAAHAERIARGLAKDEKERARIRERKKNLARRNLVGEEFGDWTVSARAPAQDGRRFWVRCACGTEAIVRARSLLSGESLCCSGCRAWKRRKAICMDCGGPTASTRAERCRKCSDRARRKK